MTLLLFILLALAEAGFVIMEMTMKSTKQEWTKKRLIVNAGEMVVFLLMVLLPGIDLGFRFKGLIITLIIRIIVSGIFFLAYRKNEKIKKRAAMILGAILSVMLIFTSLAPAFIFKDYNGRPLTGSYKVKETEAILIDSSRLETYENDGSYREVPVHFYYPEEAASIEADSLPLVIFSHGAFGYYQSNTSTCMELASNGYVVISLDHPYHSFYTKDTNGKTITVDMTFFNTALNVGNSEDISEEEIYDITSKWMELRLADMNYVIDSIKEAAATDSANASWFIEDENRNDVADAIRLIDIDKIGLMGHSLGGATAVTAGRRDDVDAVVDLDGTMLGEEQGVSNGQVIVNDTPYVTPLLAIDKEGHHNDRLEAERTGYTYANNVILNNAVEGYSTYIKGAEHMDLTDLPLFSPFLAGMLGRGTVNSEECIDLVNRLVLEFFDCYLKGKGDFKVNEFY